MRRRTIHKVAAFGGASSLLALSGCSGTPYDDNGGGGSDGGGGDSLTIAIQAWMGDKLYIKQMAESFEEETGVTVNLVEYADNQALSNFALQWSQDSSDQDIVIVDGASTAVQFLSRGLIIDFNETSFFSGELARENFVGQSLSFTELDGVQFAIPIGLEAYNISANRTFFEDADLLDADGNVPLPQDWLELYEIASALTKETGNPGMTIQWGPNAVPTLIAVEQAARGGIFQSDGETLTFDTPEMREIFEIWRRGVEEGIFSIDTFSNKDAGRSNFNADGLPMLLETASRVAEAAPTIGLENSKVVAMPGSLENGSFGFSAGVIVPTASKNQELALQFIEKAMMSKHQVGAGEEWGKLPVLTTYFDEIDAEWKDEMYEVVRLSVPAPMYRDLPVIQEQGKQMLQEYLTGGTDLDSFLDKFEGLIESSDLGTE